MRFSSETLKKLEARFGEFKISQIVGDGNPYYIKFGYWKQVNLHRLQEIISPLTTVEEDTDYDDYDNERFMYILSKPL